MPLEDYLLGVVPSELGLPQIEAQKAQAVAARTYAIANIGGYGKQGFDMVPTVWSQVYKGVSIETKMGTQAVRRDPRHRRDLQRQADKCAIHIDLRRADREFREYF